MVNFIYSLLVLLGMGKVKKAKSRRKQELHRQLQNQEAIDHQRRMLLSAGGTVLVTAAVGSLIYFARSFGDTSDQQILVPETPWDFLSAQRAPTLTNSMEVARQFVPISHNKFLRDGTQEKEEAFASLGNIHEMIYKQLEANGFDPTASYEITLRKQAFGVPENPQIAQHMIDYSKQAIAYAHNQLNIEQYPIKWTIIEREDNFESTGHQRAMIGNSAYDIMFADIINAKTGQFAFTVAKSNHSDGSRNYLKLHPNLTEPEFWSIFLGTGYMGLLSPFSEYLPLTTCKKREVRLLEELGQDGYFVLEEAITEAMSFHLGSALSQELGVPGREEILRRSMAEYDRHSRYGLVAPAIRWAGKNGMQNMLDVFMESPLEFKRTIETEL